MDPIFGPIRRPRTITFNERPAEIQYIDLVGSAVQAIERSGAEEWFERDLRAARCIAALCPQCAVFAPTGHLSLVGEPGRAGWRVVQSVPPSRRRPAYLQLPTRPPLRLVAAD